MSNYDEPNHLNQVYISPRRTPNEDNYTPLDFPPHSDEQKAAYEKLRKENKADELVDRNRKEQEFSQFCNNSNLLQVMK